jgi:hypothetical protein
MLKSRGAQLQHVTAKSTEDIHSEELRSTCFLSHSLGTSAEVKNAWSYTSIPPIRLHGVLLRHVQGQLYLHLVPHFAIAVIVTEIQSGSSLNKR